MTAGPAAKGDRGGMANHLEELGAVSEDDGFEQHGALDAVGGGEADGEGDDGEAGEEGAGGGGEHGGEAEKDGSDVERLGEEWCLVAGQGVNAGAGG